MQTISDIKLRTTQSRRVVPAVKLTAHRNQQTTQQSKKENVMKTNIYSRLKPHDEAERGVEHHLQNLPKIGSIICKHNLNKQVGICLLHKHFDVSASERLVTRAAADYWCCEPLVVRNESITPCSWMIARDPATGELCWHPIEYFLNTPEFARKAKIANTVLRNQLFLKEIAGAIDELELGDVFGLSLLDNSTDALAEGEGWFEVSSESERKMILCKVPTEKIRTIKAGTTVWDFTPVTGALPRHLTVQACWFGSSRCCCGLSVGTKEILIRIGSSAANLFN